MRIRQLDIKGDTIVEVMLALSVLGAVIVGGYSIATRSLNGVRVSQERGEALKIAEGQIETVRRKVTGTTDILSLAVDTSNPSSPALENPWLPIYALNSGFGNDIGFCVTEAGESKKIDFPDSDMKNLQSYPPECRQGVNDIYHIYIDTEGTPQSPANFNLDYKVYVHWQKAGGRELETLNLQNRFTVLYQ